jgi:hypothetical protein
MNKDSIHAKNECLYANGRKDIITNQVFHGATIKRKRKIVYFVISFHFIYKSKLMMNYENMNKLLYFLDVKDFSKLYYFNTFRWGMATCMHELMMDKTKALVQSCYIYLLFI